MKLSAQGRADVVYGAVLALGASAMFAHTFAERYNNDFLFGDVSTVFVPRILLALVVILSLCLVLKGARDKSQNTLTPVDVRRTVAVLSACIASIAGVWFIGYLIAMPVGVFLVGLAIGYPNRIVLAATALVAPLLTWVVLGQFAKVSFPLGTVF